MDAVWRQGELEGRSLRTNLNAQVHVCLLATRTKTLLESGKHKMIEAIDYDTQSGHIMGYRVIDPTMVPVQEARSE